MTGAGIKDRADSLPFQKAESIIDARVFESHSLAGRKPEEMFNKLNCTIVSASFFSCFLSRPDVDVTCTPLPFNAVEREFVLIDYALLIKLIYKDWTWCYLLHDDISRHSDDTVNRLNETCLISDEEVFEVYSAG